MATQNSDIDLSFDKHPSTNDIFRLRDDDAIRQSLYNILSSNQFDKPFDSGYGLGLSGILFENLHPGLKLLIKKKVEEVVFRYEQRVIVEDVVLDVIEDDASLVVALYYYIVGVEELQTINITVERTR